MAVPFPPPPVAAAAPITTSNASSQPTLAAKKTIEKMPNSSVTLKPGTVLVYGDNDVSPVSAYSSPRDGVILLIVVGYS